MTWTSCGGGMWITKGNIGSVDFPPVPSGWVAKRECGITKTECGGRNKCGVIQGVGNPAKACAALGLSNPSTSELACMTYDSNICLTTKHSDNSTSQGYNSFTYNWGGATTHDYNDDHEIWASKYVIGTDNNNNNWCAIVDGLGNVAGDVCGHEGSGWVWYSVRCVKR